MSKNQTTGPYTISLDGGDAMLLWGIMDQFKAKNIGSWPRFRRIVGELEKILDANEAALENQSGH